MNAVSTDEDITAIEIAAPRLPNAENKEAATESTTDSTPKYMNSFHPIIFSVLL